MQVQPYLFFSGRCEEAVAFYCGALGAEVSMLMRYRDCPDPKAAARMPPGMGDQVMHVRFRIGDSEILAADGPGQEDGFKGFSLCLSPKDEAEARRLFAALADGGKVRMELGPTFFAASFGMVTDRYGVGWMLVVPPKA